MYIYTYSMFISKVYMRNIFKWQTGIFGHDPICCRETRWFIYSDCKDWAECEKACLVYSTTQWLSTEGKWGSISLQCLFLPLSMSWFKCDKQLPFSGAGSRQKLEQRLQYPLDYMLVNSESIAIWTFSSRPLAYKSNWVTVSWIHTHMSICLHSLVPAQTFVKSLPYHAWSQRTMNKAQQ